MRLRLVEPRQGVVWIRRAFRVFGRQPIGFAAVFASCLFVLMLLSLIPIAGTAALLVLPPAGALVFMIATRIAEEGKGPMPGAFTELVGAGRGKLLELLKMGLLYAALTFLVFWLAGVLDGGAVQSMLETMGRENASPEATAERLIDPRVQLGLALRLALAGLVAIPYWHAPALVHWGGLGWSKALFFSSVAVWRNKGAFLVYALAWGALFLAMVSLVALAVGLTRQPKLAFVATPLTLVMTTVFYVSLWYTFDDSFAADEPSPSLPA